MSTAHNIQSLQYVATNRNHVILSINDYKNVKSRISVYCTSCDFFWEPTAHSYLNAKKTGCPSCKKKQVSLTHKNKLVGESTRLLIGAKASQRPGSLKNVTGPNHPRYKGGYSRDLSNPSNMDYAWKNAVRELYNHKCALTHTTSKGNRCHAHHLNSYNMFPEQRYLVVNGVYLAAEVHKHFHNIYKYGNNTELQFQEFCKSYYNIDWLDLKNKTISSQALKM